MAYVNSGTAAAFHAGVVSSRDTHAHDRSVGAYCMTYEAAAMQRGHGPQRDLQFQILIGNETQASLFNIKR